MGKLTWYYENLCEISTKIYTNFNNVHGFFITFVVEKMISLPAARSYCILALR